MIDWVYDDGGRARAGFRGDADDCVTRAVAIALQRPYRDVYDELRVALDDPRYRTRTTRTGRTVNRSPRTGIPPKLIRDYLTGLGWIWVPTMRVGAGTTVHLRADELPPGRLIVRVSRHVCAVVDGIVHDTFDPSRDGSRCVYGYYRPPG